MVKKEDLMISDSLKEIAKKEYKEEILDYIFHNIREGKYNSQWQIYDDIKNNL